MHFTILFAITASILPGLSSGAMQDCKAVDFDTFKEAATKEHVPYLGPKGLYNNAVDGSGCILLDLDEPGFADQHPSLYSSILTDAQTLIDEAAAGGKEFFQGSETASGLVTTIDISELPARAVLSRPGCGQYCAIGGEQCLYPCYCRFVGGSCNFDVCYEMYKCKA